MKKYLVIFIFFLFACSLVDRDNTGAIVRVYNETPEPQIVFSVNAVSFTIYSNMEWNIPYSETDSTLIELKLIEPEELAFTSFEYVKNGFRYDVKVSGETYIITESEI